MDNQIEQPTQAVEDDMSVGKILKESNHQTIRNVVIGGAIFIYLAGVAYAETHALSILSGGVDPDFLMWAYLGMIALGLTAVLLPLALHFWCFDPAHRGFAFCFYAVDIALLGVNSFVDFGLQEGQQLASWAQMYHDYILPATPIIAAMGWAILLLLDPSVKAFILRQRLRAAIMQAKAIQIAQAADKTSVTSAVKAAADREVESTLSELFGKPVTPIVTPTGYTMKESNTMPIPDLAETDPNPTPAAPK